MESASEGVYVDLEELLALRSSARHTTLLPRQPVRSLLAGRRASKLRGRGLDFEELRAYVAGDDVRNIDWHVTARLRKPFVRSYKEERDRPVLLVVDQRASMFFGSQGAMKSVVAARFAALAAWRVVAVGDRVGALIVGENEFWSLRPGRSASHVMRVLQQLVLANRSLGLGQPKTAEGTPAGTPSKDPFEDALKAAVSLVPHDALLVFISDLRNVSDDAVGALSRLRRHNDLLVAWVVDPLEASLPDVGRASVTDGQVDLQLPTSDARLRKAYERAHESDRSRVADLCQRSGAPFFELRTDRPLLDQVRETLGEQRLATGRRM